MHLSDLLSLPTDSLYKFLAMSGLITLFLSVILPFYFGYKIRIRLIDLDKDASIGLLKQRHIGKKIDVLEMKFERAKKDGGDDDLGEELAQVRGEQNEVDILIAEVSSEKVKMEYLSKLSQLLQWVQLAGVSLGIVMTACGFYLWDIRLQIYIDKAVAHGIIH